MEYSAFYEMDEDLIIALYVQYIYRVILYYNVHLAL